jgi:hypothetical protein
MAEEPNNLVLKLLREMREILDRHSAMHEEHRRSLATLNKKFDDWQETTATGFGLAADANLRDDAVAERLEDLTRRVEDLERAR